MLQIQPRYLQKEDWHELAVKETLRYEILEFSSYYLNKTIPEEVVEWYRETGLTDSIHGAFMDSFPISPDMRIRELSRVACENSCKLAKETGAKNVVFHSTALPFLRGPIMLGWCKEAAEYYQMLADKYDLNILMENFSDIDYEPLARMMEYVTDPRVKICLDAGHTNYSCASVAEWLEVLDEHIGYIHLSDNFGRWDDHCVLGKGSVDFASVHSWWSKQTKEIPITLEVPTIDGVNESLDYLKEHHYFGF